MRVELELATGTSEVTSVQVLVLVRLATGVPVHYFYTNPALLYLMPLLQR